MSYTPKLTYKGIPLVRCKNEVYYGNMTDPYVICMQILTNKKEGDQEFADKVHVMLLSTDTTKPPQERIARQSMKTGFYSALEIGNMWLKHALSDTGAKA